MTKSVTTDQANHILLLWESVFTSSLSGSAVVGTMATRHLIKSAAEIADAAVEHFLETFVDEQD